MLIINYKPFPLSTENEQICFLSKQLFYLKKSLTQISYTAWIWPAILQFCMILYNQE